MRRLAVALVALSLALGSAPAFAADKVKLPKSRSLLRYHIREDHKAGKRNGQHPVQGASVVVATPARG